jgi:hypothetical protein
VAKRGMIVPEHLSRNKCAGLAIEAERDVQSSWPQTESNANQGVLLRHDHLAWLTNFTSRLALLVRLICERSAAARHGTVVYMER